MSRRYADDDDIDDDQYNYDNGNDNGGANGVNEGASISSSPASPASHGLSHGLSPDEWQHQLNAHVTRANQYNSSSFNTLGLTANRRTTNNGGRTSHIVIDSIEAASSSSPSSSSSRISPHRHRSSSSLSSLRSGSNTHAQLRRLTLGSDVGATGAANEQRRKKTKHVLRSAWNDTPAKDDIITSSSSSSSNRNRRVLADISSVSTIAASIRQRRHNDNQPDMEQLREVYRQLRGRVTLLKQQVDEEKLISDQLDIKIAEQQAAVDITARMKGLVRVSVHQPRYERVTPEALSRAAAAATAEHDTILESNKDSNQPVTLLAASERLLNLRVQERSLRDRRSTLAADARTLEAELAASGIADDTSSDTLEHEYASLQSQLVHQRQVHLDMRLSFTKQIDEGKERRGVLERQLQERRDAVREVKHELNSISERRDLLQRKIHVLQDMTTGNYTKAPVSSSSSVTARTSSISSSAAKKKPSSKVKNSGSSGVRASSSRIVMAAK